MPQSPQGPPAAPAAPGGRRHPATPPHGRKAAGAAPVGARVARARGKRRLRASTSWAKTGAWAPRAALPDRLARALRAAGGARGCCLGPRACLHDVKVQASRLGLSRFCPAGRRAQAAPLSRSALPPASNGGQGACSCRGGGGLDLREGCAATTAAVGQGAARWQRLRGVVPVAVKVEHGAVSRPVYKVGHVDCGSERLYAAQQHLSRGLGSLKWFEIGVL